MQYQQGDVNLESVDSIDELEKVQSQPGIILAEGEVTGHKHRVVEKAELLRDPKGQFYLSTEVDTTIVHEEHKPITIPKGLYRVGIVQEYDYIEMQSRKVSD